MDEATEIRHRLDAINARLVEIDQVLPLTVGGEYYRQELGVEERDLRTQKRIAEARLRELTHTPNRKDRAALEERARRRETFIDAEVKVRTEQTLAFVEKLEREGDHRQARLWRRQLLDLRTQVEREFPAA